jgi:hypothetical protein
MDRQVRSRCDALPALVDLQPTYYATRLTSVKSSDQARIASAMGSPSSKCAAMKNTIWTLTDRAACPPVNAPLIITGQGSQGRYPASSLMQGAFQRLKLMGGRWRVMGDGFHRTLNTNALPRRGLVLELEPEDQREDGGSTDDADNAHQQVHLLFTRRYARFGVQLGRFSHQLADVRVDLLKLDLIKFGGCLLHVIPSG